MELKTSVTWARPLFTLAMVAAPLLVLASAIAFVMEGEGDNNGEIAGAIQVWGFILFSLVVIRLTSQFATRAPSAALVLLAVGMIGVAGGVAYGIDAIAADVYNHDSIQDTSSGAGPLALQIPGALFPLSMLGIAVMLYRSETVPVPAAALLGLGAVLFPLGNIPDIEALTIFANAVLTLAGVVLAFTLERSAGGSEREAVVLSTGSTA